MDRLATFRPQILATRHLLRVTAHDVAPTLRKVALIAHIISSVGSLGAVAAFLALAIQGSPARTIR